MNDTVTTQKGHPSGLYTLFFTEMWERFSYYGMRALLVLYLTSEAIKGGFGLERSDALEIYGLFTGLVFLTPILGGFLADKVLGQRKAIYIGGLLMALGQFSLAASVAYTGEVASSQQFLLNLGLGLLIMGNGFFKPNISTIVGSLYEANDPRKDSAFTIFYMGINLGAFFSPLVCGALGINIGWEYGFGSAGLGMMLGLVFFFLRAHTLGDAGFPPSREKEGARLAMRDYIEVLLYVAANIALVAGFLMSWSSLGDGTQNTIIMVVATLAILGLGFTVFTGTNGKDEWSRVAVILVLSVFNIFFWAGFEQAGGTFNLFAEHNTNRVIDWANWEIPAPFFQSINAIAIFAFAPVFSILWLRLSRIGKNPNTPVKFALGLILLGLGFVVMSMANNAANGGNMVSPMWLVGVYLIHTFGELCLSPIGLSMVTKLAPQKIVSIMMGLWFASMALANYMAGVLEKLLHELLPDMPLFNFLVLTSCSAGFVLLLLSPWLKKMMRGIA